MSKLSLGAIKMSFSAFFKRADARTFVFSLLLSILLFSLAFAVQYGYVVNYLSKIDVAEFQKVLDEKEIVATQTIMKIKEEILNNGVESLYDNQELYDQSSEDLIYHVYKGDELLFWTSKSIAVGNISDFEFKRSFFYKVENAYTLVLQSFYREYCCVCFIKIKDVLPLSKNEESSFANGFNLPGNIALSAEVSPYFLPIYSSDGQYLFSIQDASIAHRNYPLYILMVVLWSMTLFSLVSTSRAFFLLRSWNTKSGTFAKISIIGGFWIFIIFMIFLEGRPYGLLSVGWLSSIKFYKMELLPNLAMLLFYTLLAYSIFFYIRKNVFLGNYSSKIEDQPEKYCLVLILLKLLSYFFFYLFYYVSVNIITSTDMNVAVSDIFEVKFQTMLLLLFILLWGIILCWVLSRISYIYASKRKFGWIVAIHLIVTLFSGLFIYQIGGWMAVKVLLIFALLFLLFDISISYFSDLPFIMMSIITFLLIVMVVYISYLYSGAKNELYYQTLGRELLMENCIFEDKSSENVLRDKNYYIKTDDRLSKLVSSQFTTDSIVQQYIENAYFRFFDEKYEMQVQVCDSVQMLFLMGHDLKNRFYYSFADIEDKFRRIEETQFYVNQSETLPITYLGVFEMAGYHIYIKFYPLKTREKKAKISETELERGVSLAKYTNGELSYHDGDFRYPSLKRWIPESDSTQYDFLANYCRHYVSISDTNDSISLVSVPERQSYIFVVFVTYLFAVYLLFSLALFSYSLFKRKHNENRKSLLTRMQTIFVVPVMLTFLVLAMMTFPFFLTQYEEAQHAEMKRNTLSVQESVQNILGQSVDLQSVKSELEAEIKDLSRLFHLDIVLYDKFGRFLASSKPLYANLGSSQAYLVEPQVKFGGKLNYFCEENAGKLDYYSYYSSVYNNLNEIIGYVNLISPLGYNYVRNEVFNILVVIIDIYVFITLLSIFIIWLLNRQTTKPLSVLTEYLAQIRLTGENTRIEYKRDDEIGDLVEQYNKMVEQLMVSAENLARSEREFAWREMARRIAHEIKNPLTPMKLSVQQCQRKRVLDPDNFDNYFNKTCNILIDQIDNLSNIASEFSSFAKASESRGVKMDIVEKLESTVDLFASNSEEISFLLNLNGYKHEYVLMDDKQILQVFNNLFRNAIQAIPDGRNGLVNVSLNVEEENVLIEIRDNGCGIPKENRAEMFRPNFTTKTSGMGLGLAIVKNILLAAKGDIWFESEENVGTSFFVRIPLYKDDL